MTRGEKYSNKTPRMKFLHKNTGYIIFGIVMTLIIVGWFYYTSSQVFFEGWACSAIQGMDFTELNESELIRYNQIVSDCNNELFTP